MVNANRVPIETQLRARIPRTDNVISVELKTTDEYVHYCNNDIIKLNNLIEKLCSDLDDPFNKIENGTDFMVEYTQKYTEYKSTVQRIFNLFTCGNEYSYPDTCIVNNDANAMIAIGLIYRNISEIVNAIRGDIPEYDIFISIVTLLDRTNSVSTNVCACMVAMNAGARLSR
jgi:hypothetical protein